METIKDKHTNEQTALIVDNYPYGFRLKTKIRYWVETTKRGDRFVSQTLNPKTQEWNKPKKSTYCAVMVMAKDEKGYIRHTSLYWSTDREEILKFEEGIRDIELNELQKEQLKIIKAYSKTYENVTFTCVARRFKNKITGEITESVPLFDMSNYYEVDENSNAVDKEAEQKKERENKLLIRKSVVYNYHHENF